MELEVVIHQDAESDGYWAQVVQLPGCFAAGHTLEELEESLQEAVLLYLEDAQEGEPFSSDHVEAVRRYRLSEDRRLIPV